MSGVRKIILRNLNDDKIEKLHKFWKSFYAWFNSDALKNGIIKKEYVYYNSNWNGGTYELNIDFEHEYNIEYGESFPIFSDEIDYDEIKKYIEIAYDRWINQEKRYEFTIYINNQLKRFGLTYKLEYGKLLSIDDIDYHILDINNLNEIKLSKYEKIYSAFDEYTILGQKAQGGNSKVYEALNLDGNTVAIKVVIRSNSEKFSRYKNEIIFCEKHSNANIIPIIDHGAIRNNLSFYVMPMAKETLRDRIKKNNISSEDAEEIFVNILEGLKYAHSQGTYHRDIKPENILFMDDCNKAIIADFGIAHFSEENMIADVKTKSTDRLANFQYAAPEQKRKGIANSVDGRADVYSAGLILNEMFTGEIVSGNNYKKIEDVDSSFSYLDIIFENLYCQNPKDRLFPIENILEKLRKVKQNKY